MRGELLTRKFWAILCGLTLLAGANRVDARRKTEPASTGLRAIAIAKAPPDFAFRTPAGVTHLRDLLGTPVIVNFWATWCEPCQAELDAFAKLRELYGVRVPLLAISAEAPGVARAFLAAHHLEVTAVEDDDHRIADLYTVSALPVTLVLARDGTVTHVSIGQIDWRELHDAVDPLLGATVGVGLTPLIKSSTLGVDAGTPPP